jgi:serine/threonine protein phosphatase PrpC
MTSGTWIDPLSPLTARAGATSQKGDYREANEDAFALDRKHPLAVVLDGMGGPAAGEMAAKTAGDAIRRALARGPTIGEPLQAFAGRALRDGHAALTSFHQRDPDLRNAGATAVLAFLRGGRVFVTWAGDSMAFRVSGEKVERLTWAHDLRTYLFRQNGCEFQGFIRNCLFYYLGGELPDPVEVPAFEPRTGDRLILASDGVWKWLGLNDADTDNALVAACRSHPDPLACAEHLVKHALANETRDNSTCVVVVFDDLPSPQRRRWWSFRR